MNIKFKNNDHLEFFQVCINRAGKNDTYHQALFYLLGISAETRNRIESIYDFGVNRGIRIECLDAGWQTSGTRRICLMAFNLYNGFVDEDRAEESTPYHLFAASEAPFFVMAVGIRYPESLD